MAAQMVGDAPVVRRVRRRGGCGDLECGSAAAPAHAACAAGGAHVVARRGGDVATPPFNSDAAPATRHKQRSTMQRRRNAGPINLRAHRNGRGARQRRWAYPPLPPLSPCQGTAAGAGHRTKRCCWLASRDHWPPPRRGGRRRAAEPARRPWARVRRAAAARERAAGREQQAWAPRCHRAHAPSGGRAMTGTW